MRKHLRRMVVALVVIAFGAGAYLVGQTLWRQRKADLARVAVEMLPNVAQRIQDFHRVKVRNGEKAWEVSAREANYYEQDNVVIVTEPVVSFYGKEGQVVAVRGKEGRVLLGGKDLKGVEVSGSIQVNVDGYALQTEFANFENDANTITAPGDVRIAGHDLDIKGKHLVIDLASQRLTVKGGVQMILQPRA